MRRAHRAADLDDLGVDELEPLGLVRTPPVIGHAWRRHAPGVAHVGIEVDRLIGVGQVLGLPGHRQVARVVLGVEVAIALAPARHAGRRRHRQGRCDRAAFDGGRIGRDLRAADEAEPAVIEVVGVEVIDRVLLRARPHVDVDVAVVECREHARLNMGHQVPAEMPAGIGEPIREFFGLRQQEQPYRVVDEGRHDDDLSLDGVVGGAVRPVIRHAGGAPRIVGVDTIDHRVGEELEVAGRVGVRQVGHQRR